MDARMGSTVSTAGEYPTWDFEESDGIVPIDDDSDDQEANLAAFIQLGSIPQMPEWGTPWAEFFSGQATFAEVDQKIQNNFATLGITGYSMSYSLENEKLKAEVVKV